MKLVLHLIILLLPIIPLTAQCSTEVQAVVSEVQSKISSKDAYEIDFDIEVNYVGEPSSLQKGKMQIENNKFKLNFQNQTYISDGTTLWVHLQEDNEVQIMPLADQAELNNLSPAHLLQIYCSDDYMSQALGETMEEGTPVMHLEFTPNQKDQDLFKVRVSYDEQNKEITKVKTFNKDGSRITINAKNYKYQASFPAGEFSFNTAAHPGIHIEDMR